MAGKVWWSSSHHGRQEAEQNSYRKGQRQDIVPMGML
jgi:hypothetical protein